MQKALIFDQWRSQPKILGGQKVWGGQNV